MAKKTPTTFPVPTEHDDGPSTEVERVTPEEVLSPRKAFDPSQLEEVEVKQAVAPKLSKEELKSRVTVKKVKQAVAPKDPLKEGLPDDLVMSLSEELGLIQPSPKQVYETVIRFGRTNCPVGFRPSEADDTMWAVGVYEFMTKDPENAPMMRTPSQTHLILGHLTAASCVVSINGKSVWERVGLADAIKKSVPDWDGADWSVVPRAYASIAAQKVYGVFSKIHPNAVSALKEGHELAQEMARPSVDLDEDKDDGEEAPAENPTEAT